MLRVPCGTLCLTAALLVGANTQAQETVPSTAVVMTPPPPSGYQLLQQERLKRWETKSKRARNGLIATSAVFAVSFVFIGVGAAHCTETFNNNYVCDNTGDVMFGIGGGLFFGGGIGMIVTGILLGVRNKRIREVEREMRQAQSGFRWDPTRGSFVF